MGHEFVVVDIETTGLYPQRHKITEISAIRFKDSKIKDEFTTAVLRNKFMLIDLIEDKKLKPII